MLFSASGGDYWRLLSDGEYEVRDPADFLRLTRILSPFKIIVAAESYEPQAKLVQVKDKR